MRRVFRSSPRTALVLLLLLAACSGRCRGCPPERHEVTEKGGSQSETAVNVSNTGGEQIVMVTYNDGTADPKIQYTATKRTVLAGASLMGFSYSTNGCARKAENPQREGPDRSDLAGKDAERRLIPSPPPPRFQVVESRGTCAPPSDGVRNVAACCNDQPCHGECVTERGREAVQCACFDVVGGCREGEICCKRLRGCMKPEQCDWLP